MQRKRNWWLPYVVLEYDKNEILVDALGGDLAKPEWNYRADLYVQISVRVLLPPNRRTHCSPLLPAMYPVHQLLQYQPIYARHNAYRGKKIWAMTFSWPG